MRQISSIFHLKINGIFEIPYMEQALFSFNVLKDPQFWHFHFYSKLTLECIFLISLLKFSFLEPLRRSIVSFKMIEQISTKWFLKCWNGRQAFIYIYFWYIHQFNEKYITFFRWFKSILGPLTSWERIAAILEHLFSSLSRHGTYQFSRTIFDFIEQWKFFRVRKQSLKHFKRKTST